MNYRRVILLVTTLALGVGSVHPVLAQRGEGRLGGRERPSAQEQQKAREQARAKMFETLQIGEELQPQVAAVLDTLDLERRQIMEDARSGGRDPEVFRQLRQDMEDLTKAFDEKLKKILGEQTFALYATYRDAEQAARRDQRGGGRGDGGRRGSR